MRTLTKQELGFVCGGNGECTPANPSGNSIGGVSEPSELGDDLVAAYEGIVQAASHIIERVADAL